MIPVHPEDRSLLGMRWEGQLYVDKALPFGLRSAPKIFNAMADGLMWIMGEHGVRYGLHYLDDYLLFGRPRSQECLKSLSTALGICKELGVQVSPHTSTTLTFLGIELDTGALEIRLPQEKLCLFFERGRISVHVLRKSYYH